MSFQARRDSGSFRPPTCAVLAAALAAMLAFASGEAAAQSSCPGASIPGAALPSLSINPGDQERWRQLYLRLLPSLGVTRIPTNNIDCYYVSQDRNNRAIVVHTPAITVVDDWVPGILAEHQGIGHLGIYVHAIELQLVNGVPHLTGRDGHPHPLTDPQGQGIETKGNAAEYITGEESYGIHAKHGGEGRVGIDVRNISVRTTGDYAHGVYARQEGSYIFRDNGDSTRARGAVVINLIETERDRDGRTRPLIGTRGDHADAIRAEYTRAAAYGHIAVTVEGYDIATGGVVPLDVVAHPRDPGRFLFDFTRPYVANPNYDPDDPNSPQFYNVRLREDLQRQLDAGNPEAVFQELGLNPIFPPYVLSAPIDIRPYTLVYLPIKNPDYDSTDPDSKPFIARTYRRTEDGSNPHGTADIIWNGRYFRAVDENLAADVYSCQNKPTEVEQTACFKEKIEDQNRDAGNPTGFESRGIYASHGGHGDIRIRATDNRIRTWGATAQGIYATHTGRTTVATGEGGSEVVTPGGGSISITVTGGSIATGDAAAENRDYRGTDSHGIWARHRGDGGTDERDFGYGGDNPQVGTGDIAISVTDTIIGTGGDHARGIYGLIQRYCAGTDGDGRCNSFVEGTGIGDIVITVTGGTIATGGDGGAYAVQARHENKGAIAIAMTRVDATTAGEQAHGVFAEHRGSEGAVAVTVDGGSISTEGVRAHAVNALQSTDGGLTVRVVNGATVTTEGWGARGVNAVNNGAGDLTVELDGAVGTKGVPSSIDVSLPEELLPENEKRRRLETIEMASVFVVQNGAGGLTFRMTGGTVTAEGDEAHGVQVVRTTPGGGSIAIAGGSVRAEGEDSAGVLAGFTGGGTGTVSVSVAAGASVSGGQVGIQLSATADADGNLPARTVQVDGTVTGGTSAGIYLTAGGEVTVGTAGRVGAASGIGIFSSGDQDATVTVAGTVAGDILKVGGGNLAFSSQAGSTVTGDVRAETGQLTLDLAAGSTVAGTVHDPGNLAVRGSIGRLLYSGTAAVTVTATGRLTGVEGDDGTEAIRSTAGRLTFDLARGGQVTGDIRTQGALAATLAGTLTGDLRSGGDLTATVSGTATGDIRSSGDLTATIAGTATGDIRADGDLTAEVAGTVSGGIRADGDLMATISGMVGGDILGLGTGDHTVTVREGGEVSGTIRLAASTVTMAGTAGRVWLQNGGMVTVGATGRLTGVEGDDGTEAIRSDSGSLTATLAGRITGDVLALGSGTHRVTVAQGGDVAGTVRMATETQVGGNANSALTVDGAVGRVQLDRGGALTVGQEGRIRGIDGVAVAVPDNRYGVHLVIQETSDETAGEKDVTRRVSGEVGGNPQQRSVSITPADGSPTLTLGRLNTKAAAPRGPYDLGVDANGNVVREYAPRARVYEAMPSVLLVLNRLPTRGERMAAQRSSNGAWALVEAGDGIWQSASPTATAASASVSDIAYGYRRYGVRAGFEVPVGEDGPVLGIFVHHRRVAADMAWNEGDIKAQGTGFGVAAAWQSGGRSYFDGQLQGTWHKADLTSNLRGAMKSGSTGTGYAFAIEAGHRLAAFGDGRRGMALVPRARLAGAKVDMGDFTDAVGSRVSLEKGRSMVGSAGLGVEALPPIGSGRLFGSLDAERVFSSETRVDVAGIALTSEPEETWLRAQMGGVFEWNQGRYALQGALSYATAGSDNRELGGNMSLSVRF